MGLMGKPEGSRDPLEDLDLAGRW